MSCQKYIPLMGKKWKKGGQRRDSRGGKKLVQELIRKNVT